MYDFEVGMEVIVHAPPPEEKDDFCCSWNRSMDPYNGQTGKIISSEVECELPYYNIMFNDYCTWWWDARYMEHTADYKVTDISDEEFDSMLF